MALVYIFVAVARRLGIEADPANFPGVVQARVQPPNGESAKLVDMRGDDPPVEFPQTDYIHFWPVMLSNQEEYTRPASPATMLQRACNNISAFIQQEIASVMSPVPGTHDSAFYAASCWAVLSMQADHILPSPPDSKPLDYLAVLYDGMCPHLPEDVQSTAASHYQGIVDDEETRAQTVKLHSRYPAVEYFVGLPFLHKRHGYLGVVYGWDVSTRYVYMHACSHHITRQPTCMASEEWMDHMHVDLLKHGRNQPFYHAIPFDGQPRCT